MHQPPPSWCRSLLSFPPHAFRLARRCPAWTSRCTIRPPGGRRSPKRRTFTTLLTPAQAATILGNLNIGETLSTAIDAAASSIKTEIQAELGAAPGGQHAIPWRQTGRLQDSIAHTVDGLEAAIGSNDPAAAPQELGTLTLSPRPFFAPVAAAIGERIANRIGAATAHTIARSLT